MPTDPQAALRRDRRIATQLVAPVRRQFRRERDRLAADPEDDPVRTREWVVVFAGLWAITGDQVYAATVRQLAPNVTAGPVPQFPRFAAAAAVGLAATSRRRIADVRAVKPPNLSRQLRKLYQLDFVKRRAVRVALDQALRQTATFENAAANRIQQATGQVVSRQWRNQGDSRVRESHQSVAPVRLDEPFIVGGSMLAYPRDPAGPASETFGCRCWVEHDIAI